MPNAADTALISVPWWLDRVAEGDVVERPEPWSVDVEYGPMCVAETLLAVAAVGPGIEAMRLLTSLRGRQLSGDEQLTVVQLWQPQLAWAAGAEQAAVLELAANEPVGQLQPSPSAEFMALELAAALHATVDHATAKIRHARLLAHDWAATGDRLRAGTLDPYRVWLITQVLGTLDVEAAQQVEVEILPLAASMTGWQLKKALRKAARIADPEWGTRRFAETRRSRRVWFDPQAEDGLVGMYAFLPPVEAIAMQRQLEERAGLRGPDGDDRRHDERMADALMACVLGSRPGDPTTPLAPKVLLQVLVPLPTLVGLRDDTAELIGYGDLPGGIARELAGDADWQRWVNEPGTGHLLDLGKKRYRPGTQLAEFVQARDRHCQFPGSSRSAKRADLDHVIPFDAQEHGQGGSTSADNLAALSRRAHRAKTHGDYQTRRSADGRLRWITPLGRTYESGPYDYRADSDR